MSGGTVRVAFDTSVLVPAVLERHPHHDACRRWLVASVNGGIDGVASVRAVAETWSVLTRVPLPAPLSASLARRVTERAVAALDLRPTTLVLAQRAMDLCELCGARSGAIHDAVHAAAALEAEVEVLLTVNVRDFERFSLPGLQIRSPLDTPIPVA